MQQNEILKRIKEIKKGSEIYTTRDKRKYKFVCLGKLQNEETIEYSIPHRIDDGVQTKKIRTNHILIALGTLLKQGTLKRGDLMKNDCVNDCNFRVLGGMLKGLYNKVFIQEHGKIIYNKK